jgi:integrase/recombinase XerD
MKPALAFEFIEHKAKAVILLKFGYNPNIVARLKQIASPAWSSTHKGWWVLDTPKMRSLLKIEQVVKAETNFGTGETVAVVSNQHAAHQYLAALYKDHKIFAPNQHVLPNMQQQLVLKGYSSNTIRTYLGEMAVFLAAIKNNVADEFSVDRIKQYFAYCLSTLKISENTAHSRMNALKFYYEQVLGKTKFFVELPRPKKPQKLPKVISEESILKGLLGVANKKHRALLFLAYSAGLRVSEVVKIKITDINYDRSQLLIEGAKGKKDRMVTLAKSLVPIIEDYKKDYSPSFYLFEGQNRAAHYNARSAQVIFKAAFNNLGLDSRLSFHSLRHSFATHLLDGGTDISYIQKMLGHNDIKTTLIYADVSQKKVAEVESPLDKLMRKNENKKPD